MAKLTINNSKVLKDKPISELVTGEIFSHLERFYILTNDENRRMGVDLATGEVVAFDYPCRVVPIKATLHIEARE